MHKAKPAMRTRRAFIGEPQFPASVTLTEQDIAQANEVYLKSLGRKPSLNEAMALKLESASYPRRITAVMPKSGRVYGKRVNGKLIRFTVKGTETVKAATVKKPQTVKAVNLIKNPSLRFKGSTLSRLSGNFR